MCGVGDRFHLLLMTDLFLSVDVSVLFTLVALIIASGGSDDSGECSDRCLG